MEHIIGAQLEEGVVLVNKEKPIFYTCYNCRINFQAIKCPRCGKKGTPIYNEPTDGRPENNPTDINAFFERKRKQ